MFSRGLAALLAIAAGACHGADGSRNAPNQRATTANAASARAASSNGSATSAPPAASNSGSASLPPLAGTWLERLELDGGGVAFAAPPVGAREPRPVIVAVHGAGDRPEWSCGGWRLAAHEFAFVLCPQGTPVPEHRFAWASSRQITDLIERALTALRGRYGAYVANAPLTYAGFSQGAILAGPVLLDPARRFSTAVLAEGGYDSVMTAAFAQRFAANGGQRALLVCGGSGCLLHAHAVALPFARAGIQTLVTGDPLAGHNLNERMQRALQTTWPELVRGLPGWESFR